MKQKLYLACALTVLSAMACAATVEEAKKDILATYDFDPSTMTYDQQADRAPSLSALWSRFGKSPEAYRDALRALLGQEGGREMLYCDGGMLFLGNAIQAADKRLGLKSIAACSLAEIQHTPYFYTMHEQARAGEDVLALQLKMLTKPKYQIFVPPHALTLAQNFSFVYPLLVQDERKYTGRLIEKLQTEKDPVALNTLLMALYFSALPDAEAAVRAAATSMALPKDARERATLIAQRIDDVRKTDAARVKEWLKKTGMTISPSASEQDLRSARRERMRTISDEALSDLEGYTRLIYRARK